MSELFPTELRGVGIGAWCNITVALFGGTAPLVISFLAGRGRSDWFFFYVTAGAAIGFLTILMLREAALDLLTELVRADTVGAREGASARRCADLLTDAAFTVATPA